MKNKEMKVKAMSMAVAMSMVVGLCPSTIFAATGSQTTKDGTYTKTAHVARTAEDDENEDEDDEIIWVSKSEIKRDAEELKRLGMELMELGKNALDKIPLDEDLRAAIDLAQKIKKEGRRRQVQLIGKMMRSRDMDPIRVALDKLKNRHNQQVALFHKLEALYKSVEF